MQIYAEFGWTDAPREHLGELQNQHFGPARKWQSGDRQKVTALATIHAPGGSWERGTGCGAGVMLAATGVESVKLPPKSPNLKCVRRAVRADD